MSLREQGKQQRRDRILSAAEKLTIETGDTSFSMQMLAKEAGVSFVTPFNLFGSKAQILGALLRSKLASEQSAEQTPGSHSDPSSQALELAASVVKAITNNATLIRPLLLSVGGAEGPDHASIYDWALSKWKGILQDAIDAQFVRPDIDIDFYACAMHVVLRGSASLWLRGELDDHQYEMQVQYGISALFFSIATNQAELRIKRRMRRIARDYVG